MARRSVYKVIEVVGTSSEPWEKAAAAAVEMASQSLRDLRIAEVVEFDMRLEDGKVCSGQEDIEHHGGTEGTEKII